VEDKNGNFIFPKKAIFSRQVDLLEKKILEKRIADRKATANI
jgi:hypothetical protein